MEYIYDINSGLKHSIFSKQGIQLLKQYVKVFQNGVLIRMRMELEKIQTH